MEIIVSSHISPIFTGIDGQTQPKSEVRELYTFTKPINSKVTVTAYVPVSAKQEIREVASSVQPVQSDTNTYISKNITVKSHVQNIQDNTERRVSIFRNTESYVSSIQTNVSTSVLSPDNDTLNVSSYIKPINSSVHIETYRYSVSVERNVTSHTKPLEASTDVLTDIMIIPIQVSTIAQQNPSMAFYIANPSYVEVVE